MTTTVVIPLCTMYYVEPGPNGGTRRNTARTNQEAWGIRLSQRPSDHSHFPLLPPATTLPSLPSSQLQLSTSNDAVHAHRHVAVPLCLGISFSTVPVPLWGR
ncbi:hypothetical protein I7I51_08058 [Histoplasma capsulatum]|uniref:Uncharacterized protein n=1 Tax=Ajellomyces capsulatus TaxID=5037 RepID=A0A8A1LZK5_AJECA|nr:hypothetical protein I7I51_08058 [Histoplasma capsulatum]